MRGAYHLQRRPARRNQPDAYSQCRSRFRAHAQKRICGDAGLRLCTEPGASAFIRAATIGLTGTRTKKVEPTENKECPENLKSLYLAFSLYVESNGSLPPADKWMDNQELTSRIQKDEWLHCPEVSNRKDTKFGYAYNDAVAAKSLDGKKLAEMPDAARTPLLYDSDNLAKSAHDAFRSLPANGRHAGKNNVLYCDGHINAVRP